MINKIKSIVFPFTKSKELTDMVTPVIECAFTSVSELETLGIGVFTGGIHSGKYVEFKKGKPVERQMEPKFIKFHKRFVDSPEPCLFRVGNEFEIMSLPSIFGSPKIRSLHADETNYVKNAHATKSKMYSFASTVTDRYNASIKEFRNSTKNVVIQTPTPACAGSPSPSEHVVLECRNTAIVTSKPAKEKQQTPIPEFF